MVTPRQIPTLSYRILLDILCTRVKSYYRILLFFIPLAKPHPTTPVWGLLDRRITPTTIRVALRYSTVVISPARCKSSVVQASKASHKGVIRANELPRTRKGLLKALGGCSFLLHSLSPTTMGLPCFLVPEQVHLPVFSFFKLS